LKESFARHCSRIETEYNHQAEHGSEDGYEHRIVSDVLSVRWHPELKMRTQLNISYPNRGGSSFENLLEINTGKAGSDGRHGHCAKADELL
jgi:hypothetical protein